MRSMNWNEVWGSLPGIVLKGLGGARTSRNTINPMGTLPCCAALVHRAYFPYLHIWVYAEIAADIEQCGARARCFVVAPPCAAKPRSPAVVSDTCRRLASSIYTPCLRSWGTR